MKRSTGILLIFLSGLLLVGFRSRPYSDLAEYRRLPMKTRIARFQKAGEELFLRRKFEDSLAVFNNILALDDKNLQAKMWIAKVKSKLSLERNEQKKLKLKKKYGQLIPKELTYYNWHWGPSVGHFKVRYSKPKPYVPPVRKVHPRATDKELEAAKKKAESGNAEDLFELAMQHWSRKESALAIEALTAAVKVSPAILEKDDELLLATVEDEMYEKIYSNKASAKEYFTTARLAMLQGDDRNGIKFFVKAATKDEELKTSVKSILASYIDKNKDGMKLFPPDFFSFRQAYVYQDKKDLLYLNISLYPRGDSKIIPVDLTLDKDAVQKIEIKSGDAICAYGMPGTDESIRLWIVLADKDVSMSDYNIKMVLHLNADQSPYVDLSNFNLATDQPDNWSFVFGPEVSFEGTFPKGEIESIEDGLRISGFQLSVNDGNGPVVRLNDFRNPLPKQINVWKLMDKTILEKF